MTGTKAENPLGSRPVGRLLASLAIPAIIANVVNALYNLVDQIFIGQDVGKLGNAATSVSFPLTTLCLAIGLMVGLGSAAGFNLELGRGREDKARAVAGTAVSVLLICGVTICLTVKLFLSPLLTLFGATGSILPYAETYAGITSWGIPFLLFSIGLNPLVRADRSSRYSMAAIVIGSVLNTVLDPLFIFVFGWGIAGAAWATVIGQATSAAILLAYFPRFRSVSFTLRDFIPRARALWTVCKLGFNSFIFQFSNLLVQVSLNNTLGIYGAASPQGADTPIAVAGIVMKINVIFTSLIIGLVNGAQPICSFNYGARKYGRVRHTVKLLMTAAVIVSTVVWAVFQLFPRPILSLFGNGSEGEEYYAYAVRFMRVFLFFVFVNGVQICSATFFPAIGKAAKGAIISFSKQVALLIPLIWILPRFFGLDGVMFAQPVTDLLAFLIALLLLILEMRQMPKTDMS